MAALAGCEVGVPVVEDRPGLVARLPDRGQGGMFDDWPIHKLATERVAGHAQRNQARNIPDRVSPTRVNDRLVDQLPEGVGRL
jgi:hypothetical protein